MNKGGLTMNRSTFEKAITLLFIPGIFVLSLLMSAENLPAAIGQHNHSINLHPIEKMQPAGEYVIEVRNKDSWQKAGTVSCDRFYREQEVALAGYTSNGKEITIRITQQGGGAAHIDAVLLGNIPPKSVIGADEKGALKKITQKDFDVIDAFQKSIELTFPVQSTEQRLKLIARIESTTISKIPFQFPRENLFREMNDHSEFYHYKLNSSIKNTGGDEITKAKPFFREYSLTGSGHPAGFTYGWVANDDKDLHVYLDFTSDNTMDGNKDYATVYAKTASGLKAFRVSMAEQKWGNPEFTYTERVNYQHKAYRFSIPLNELGISQGETASREIQLAFAAYGTSSPGEYVRTIAYDSVNNRYLLVYLNVDNTNNYSIHGQLLNWDGSYYGSEILIYAPASNNYAESPSVAYDSANQRFLIAWNDRRNSPVTGSDIYGQLVSAEGVLYHGNIAICTAAGDQSSPSVAFDSANNRFLVAWHDYRNGASDVNIYGQIVTAAGGLYNGTISICTAASVQYFPSVAYDSANQRFLVAFEDHRNGAANGRDIYGQVVNAGGTLFGGNFDICIAPNSQYYPSVAYDSANQRFLVAWQDLRNSATTGWDIYGQLVTAGGAVYGGNISICTAAADQYDPSVAYDNYNQRFLVAWSDYRNSITSYGDIYGQLVNAGGSPYGGNFAITEAAGSQYTPSFAYNDQMGNFLIAYSVWAAGMYYTDWILLNDADGDGFSNNADNCVNIPNGPNLGTCVPGSDKAGATCMSDADCAIGCSSNGFCSMNQEDSDADGVGDVCDIDAKIKVLVREYYLNILGREPDTGGWNYWTSEIKRTVGLGIYVGEGFQAEARFFFNSPEYLSKNTSATVFVTALYHTFLQREPDSEGLTYYVGQLSCLTRNMLITEFANSAEFKQLMMNTFGPDPTRPENNLVNDFYRGFLNRFPDDAGFNAYVSEMRDAQCTGAEAVKNLSYQIALSFEQSAEYAARNRNNTQYIEDLFNGILRRSADCAGFLAWVNILNSGTSRASVLKSFTDSTEFQARVNAVIAAGCSHG